MDLARPFRVVTPTVDGDVLAVLAGADATFTAPQVHALIGAHSVEGVRKSLNRLRGEGIVRATRSGQAWSYELNREHLAAPSITALAGLRQELFRRLEAELEGWGLPAAFAALFGSGATGGMHVHSDIDLFVVRPDRVDAEDGTWREQLDALASAVTGWTGNDVRILEYGATETIDAARSGADPVLTDIRDEGIVLTGRRRYLHQLLDAPR